MRWLPWIKKIKPAPVEPVEIPENARYVVTTHPSGHALVVPAPSGVIVEPVVYTAGVTPLPDIPRNGFDPYDIEPAFAVRYKEVKLGHLIDTAALRHNVRMFKLQAREVIVDPKRVVRRHLHRHLQARERKQRMRDSFLFYNVKG